MLAVLTTSAAPVNVDIGTWAALSGNTGAMRHTLTISGLEFTAFSVSKFGFSCGWSDLWADSVISSRHEAPDDVGVGVCKSATSASCPMQGNGVINEIANSQLRNYTAGSLTKSLQMFDVIRLGAGINRFITKIGLSSLDGGAKDNFQIYGSNGATPNFLFGTIAFTLARGDNGTTHGVVNPVLNLLNSYCYVFVTTEDRSKNQNNFDFLLRSATYGSSVP